MPEKQSVSFKELLASASNDLLCQLLARVLNMLHDAGGVSAKRSLRSVYLEVVLEYLQYHCKDRIEMSTENRNQTLVIEEVQKRTGKPKPVQQVLFFSIQTLSDRGLAQLAAHEMFVWYIKDAERLDPVNFLEYQISETMYNLLKPDFPLPQFNDPRELLFEWDDRNVFLSGFWHELELNRVRHP